MSERQKSVMVVFGTRPEAIKLAPLIKTLSTCPDLRVLTCITAQHREMLDQALDFFGITPDFDLDIMRQGQSLDELASRLLVSIGATLDEEKPQYVVVHGDTLTTMMATLACYFRHIPVAHVEAGLRSDDIHAPWPEEVSRRVADMVADLHFAPTPAAMAALKREGVPDTRIHLTGNTVIDALLEARRLLAANPSLASVVGPLRQRLAGRRVIAVTAHRRENQAGGMEHICNALEALARRQDVALVVSLHRNPVVAEVFRKRLGALDNAILLEALDYPDFVSLMDLADLILTDSGGVQEEAPSLGTPVLVMREVTERPEGIAAGTARLVGTDPQIIEREAARLLDDDAAHAAMSLAHNPYGDGTASAQIASILQRTLAASA